MSKVFLLVLYCTINVQKKKLAWFCCQTFLSRPKKVLSTKDQETKTSCWSPYRQKTQLFFKVFLEARPKHGCLGKYLENFFFPSNFWANTKKSFLAQRLRNVERNLLEPHTQKNLFYFSRIFVVFFSFAAASRKLQTNKTKSYWSNLTLWNWW